MVELWHRNSFYSGALIGRDAHSRELTVHIWRDDWSSTNVRVVSNSERSRAMQTAFMLDLRNRVEQEWGKGRISVENR
jgi:hypothetical protein